MAEPLDRRLRMADTDFQCLSVTERRKVSDLAARQGGRKALLLQRDTCVMEPSVCFSRLRWDGISCSWVALHCRKVWRTIQQFSEDTDTT